MTVACAPVASSEPMGLSDCRSELRLCGGGRGELLLVAKDISFQL